MAITGDKEVAARPTHEAEADSGESPTPPAEMRGPQSEWRRPLLVAVAVVVTVRALLSVWAAVVLAYFPTTDLQEQAAHVGIPVQTEGLAAPWQREDALWYEKIATVGYSPNDGTTVFLPLLPLLMRPASVLTFGNVALAGLLVSLLAEIATLALLYRLAGLDGGEGVSFRSVLYLALFPTAFFLLSAFTESLFLALAIGAFWHARHGRWWPVALLTGLSALAKMQGALLCLPLVVEYLMQARGAGLRNLRLPGRAAELAAVALAGPLATFGFFAYIRYVVGDTISWSERQNAMWHHEVTWPGETLAVAVQKVLGEGQFTINTFDLLVFILVVVLGIFSFRLRWSYGLQVVTVLVPSLLHVGTQFPLMSFSRYALSAFPCFIVLALWSSKRPPIVHKLILALSASLLLVWASQFVRGYWVG